ARRAARHPRRWEAGVHRHRRRERTGPRGLRRCRHSYLGRIHLVRLAGRGSSGSLCLRRCSRRDHRRIRDPAPVLTGSREGVRVGRAMASMQQPVKSSELDRLLAVFRENPKSTVFISLAQGYIAAGRAAEAIDVLNQGLGNYPDHTEARLLLGRAFSVLHRWKEAEAELVKVVKLDRYSQQGFALLGEILVRRGNFDVAAKAPQRAVDLPPLDDRPVRMLGRARLRRPLDPPPPIPGETQPLVGSSTPSPFSLSPPLALGSSLPRGGLLADDELEHDEGPTVVSL